MAFTNNSGQTRVGVRRKSTLWLELYSVWNANNNALDSFGTNDGTLMNGASFTTGKIGQAFTFDGVNDYVSLPNNSLNLTGDFSGSAWVYVPSGYIGNSAIYMFCNLWAPAWAINFKGWRFYLYGNAIGFSVADGSSYNGNSGIYDLRYGVGGAGIPRDVWTHFAFTRKASVGTKIYMNGSLVISDTNTVNQVYNTTHTPTVGNMYIPGVQNDYYAPANTRIDALNLWNKELNASEVAELYNGGAGKQY